MERFWVIIIISVFSVVIFLLWRRKKTRAHTDHIKLIRKQKNEFKKYIANKRKNAQTQTFRSSY